MSVWAEVFLGVIAVGDARDGDRAGRACSWPPAGSRGGWGASSISSKLELKPVFGHLNAIGRDASRAAALATAQVERVDRLLTDLTQRLDETFQTFQATLAGPARRPAVLRARRRRPSAPCAAARPRARASEEEDALFI